MCIGHCKEIHKEIMVANAILSTDAAPQLETYPLCTKIKRLFYSVINMAA